MNGSTMGDWTMEGLAFGTMLISMASVFVLCAWLWLKNGAETRGGSLEGIGRNCPDGYKLVDHIRDFRQGGGTALLFRDSLTVKKVGGGAKMSFEFSEWTVQLASSYGLRLVVVYRPQSDSDDHRIPWPRFSTILFTI